MAVIGFLADNYISQVAINRIPSPVLELDGIAAPQEQILGYGRSGLVIRVENTALKIPLRYIRSSDDEVEINTEVIQREQEAYRR